MRRLLGFYRQQIAIGVAVQLQYRVAMLLWVAAQLVPPLIYLSVWRATAAEGEIAGFSAATFSAYYLVMMVVDHFVNTSSFYTMESLVRRGDLSQYLLRALDPIHTEAAYDIGFKVLMVTALLPSVLLLALIFRPTLNPPGWSLLLFPMVLLLAAALSFLLGWMISLSAFWIIRVNAFARLYLLMAMFFAGRIAPLTLLPEALQSVAAVLPFRWMVAFPVELGMGRLTPSQAFLGIGAQIGWLIVAFAACRVLWREGVRRYDAVGG
jgi:ABC-2 type transport system permease protein